MLSILFYKYHDGQIFDSLNVINLDDTNAINIDVMVRPIKKR